jgi:hypothetical protein
VNQWIRRPNAQPEDDLPLKNIGYYRRYGDGRCFEFLCHWYVRPPKTGKKRPQISRSWHKYVDLQRRSRYSTFIRSHGWDIELHKNLHWEQNEVVGAMSDVEDNYEDECYRQSPEGKTADLKWKKLTKKKKRKKDLSEIKHDLADLEEENGDLGLSDSTDDSDSDNESDEDTEKRTQKTTRLKSGKRNILSQSSCDPVPLYKVHQF